MRKTSAEVFGCIDVTERLYLRAQNSDIDLSKRILFFLNDTNFTEGSDKNSATTRSWLLAQGENDATLESWGKNLPRQLVFKKDVRGAVRLCSLAAPSSAA